MIRRSAFTRGARAALVVASLTALSACGKENKGADSSAAAMTDSSAVAPAPIDRSISAAAIASLPGALTKPLAQYTADEFYTFTHALKFGGGTDQPRKCKKNPECEPSGGKRTSARVDAVDGQDSLSATAVPSNGVVAVQARNTGKLEEARYGMLPGPYEYYLVVLPGTDGKTSWGLQQLETTAGARKLTQIATGTFHPCNHKAEKATKVRASFYNCDDSHMSADSGPAGGGDTDPIWIGCSQGCCLAAES